MALTTVLAIFGTGRVWAGTDAWTSIGPQGGEIKALSVDPHNPQTLYAATSFGGAFKSLDGGANWVKSGMPNRPLVFDPQDPKTIYVFDYGQGISKSTDGGTSWNPADSGLYPLVNALAIDPLKPSTLYAGTAAGIFKSTDGGTTWSLVSSGLLPLSLPGPPRQLSGRSLAIDPQDPSTLYAVVDGIAYSSGPGLTVEAAGGFVKSTDGGGSWNLLDIGLPQTHTMGAVLAIDPQNPSTLWVGTNYGMFKSKDGGVSWNPVNSGLPQFATGLPPFPNRSPFFLAVAIDPLRPDTVYARIYSSSRSTIFKTTNGGASWSDAGSGLPEGFNKSLQIDPQISTALYAGTKLGVFKSTDGGTRWTEADSGLTAMGISDVAIDPRNANTLYAATSIGLVKTTDGGTNWSRANSNVPLFSRLAIDPQNTSTVFANGCLPDTNCGVIKSTDGGASWSASWIPPYPGIWITTLAIDPRNSNIVYATADYDCGMETLRKSVDGGMRWSHFLFKDMGVLAACLVDLVVDPQNSGHLYAAFQFGGVFKSTDGGATWNAANSGLSPGAYGYNAVALAIDKGSPGTVYAVSSSGVFKSSDGGVSWNPASSGLPDYWSGGFEECCFRPRLVVDPQNSARLVLGISVDRVDHVFQSSDGGASWKDSGLPWFGSSGWFGGLAISSQGPSTVYAGCPGQGVCAMTFPPEP